jgi:hypothetical protein
MSIFFQNLFSNVVATLSGVPTLKFIHKTTGIKVNLNLKVNQWPARTEKEQQSVLAPILVSILGSVLKRTS